MPPSRSSTHASKDSSIHISQFSQLQDALLSHNIQFLSYLSPGLFKKINSLPRGAGASSLLPSSRTRQEEEWTCDGSRNLTRDHSLRLIAAFSVPLPYISCRSHNVGAEPSTTGASCQLQWSTSNFTCATSSSTCTSNDRRWW